MKPCTIYTTVDGKQFQTSDKAAKHELDLCREHLDFLLKESGVHNAKDAFKIIMAIIPDSHGRASDNINTLANIINFKPEG